jgi:hypothetical protein
MPLLHPLLPSAELLLWLRRVPVSTWVALALAVGAAPWIAAAVELAWPGLLP